MSTLTKSKGGNIHFRVSSEAKKIIEKAVVDGLAVDGEAVPDLL